jgi:hypothetical protein
MQKNKFEAAETAPKTETIHNHVTCDGCGMTPMIGNRYRCSMYARAVLLVWSKLSLQHMIQPISSFAWQRQQRLMHNTRWLLIDAMRFTKGSFVTDVAPLLLFDTDNNAKHVRPWISASHANVGECMMFLIRGLRCLFLKQGD